ncbi:hypothetical protein ACFWPK_28490 [Nocardia sp. NPDC058519]|uniref:hypothetical protein n=1 Tax=Nocardia sp. NPDC058519 TaxID=3346535 RepID=UPI003650A134
MHIEAVGLLQGQVTVSPTPAAAPSAVNVVRQEQFSVSGSAALSVERLISRPLRRCNYRGVITRSMFRAVAVSTSAVAMAMLWQVPAANADVVPQHAAPPYEGSVRISTVAGGFVDVQITGRGRGWAYDQHRPQYCQVSVGEEGRMIPIDSAGNGSARLGPLKNGTYSVSGRCVDQEHMTGSNLLNRNIDIVLDGQPTGAGSGGSTPIPAQRSPLAQSLSSYCDSTADAINAIGMAGFLFTPAVGAATSLAALGASAAVRLECQAQAAALGDQSTATDQGCRNLEDFAYAVVESVVGNRFPLLGGLPLQQFMPSACSLV